MHDEADIPIHDHSALRQVTSTGDGPLPTDIVERYWEVKRLSDRVASTLHPALIVWMAYELGYATPNAKELTPPSILDLVKAKKCKRGDPVEFTWRGETQTGTFSKVKDNMVGVRFDSDGDERLVPVSDVSLLEAAIA